MVSGAIPTKSASTHRIHPPLLGSSWDLSVLEGLL